MLNSTIAGGYEKRAALVKASMSGEVSTDWCVGGCKHWDETEEGRQRFETLRAINQQEKEAGRPHIR